MLKSKNDCRILLLLCLFGIACRSRDRNDSSFKVTNPGPASSAFESVVRLEITWKNGSEHICSGTFVGAKDRIITAAHCFFDDEGKPVASLTYEKDGRVYKAAMFPNPDYNHLEHPWDTRGKDLAMIKLDRPVEDAKVAILAAESPKVNDPVTIVGFGKTSLIPGENNWGAQNVGTNVVLDIEDNLSELNGFGTSSAIGHAPGVNSLPGPGDSGGAMFNAKGELVGVNVIGGLKHCADQCGNKLAMAWVINIADSRSKEIIKAAVDNMCNGKDLKPSPCAGSMCSIQ